MDRNSIHERLGKRYWRRLLILLSIAFVSFFGWIIWSIGTAFPYERTTIVIAGDPVRIVSWNSVRKKVTILNVPADVRITGAQDVGLLPIGSLERLESLDGQKKDIYRRSLSLAFAVPIRGALRRGEPTQTVGEALAPSFSSLWATFPVKRSGISMALRFRLWWSLLWIRPDAIVEFDAVKLGMTNLIQLPDGSSARVLDPDTYDTRSAGLFELDGIRQEELRVRVINTTGVAGRGAAFARILSHAGFSVVALENDEDAQPNCSFQSNTGRPHHESKRFLEDTLGCRYLESTGTDADVDITVRLGSEELL
ncbi:LytR C-terminal domain-containing protein [Candidatus Gottesmanbacteria bacterium]|nr:LytR C-terminal domain-containing protein [Candidatus Gottesmanbacteria bacterium]